MAGINNDLRNEIDILQRQVDDLEAEKAQLKDENEKLHQLLDEEDSDNKVTRDLRETVHRLQDKEARLKSQLQEHEKKTQAAEKKANQQSKELTRIIEENRILNEKVEEQTRLFLRERQMREATASEAAGKAGRDKTSHRVELANALAENQELRTQLGAVQADLETLAVATQQLDEDLVEQQQETNLLKKTNFDLEAVVQELRQQLTEQKEEEKRLLQEIAKLDERENEHKLQLSTMKSAQKRDIEALTAELESYKSTLALMQKKSESQQLRDGGSSSGLGKDVPTLLAKIADLEQARNVDKQELVSTQAELDKTLADLETLWELGEQYEEKLKAAVEEATNKERLKNQPLEEKVAQLQGKLQQQRQMIQEYEERLGKVEKDLREAEAWNAAYEKKAGLEDLVRYQKKLKADIKRRDQDIRKLTTKLGEQLDATGILQATCQRLKAELGRTPEFEYDELTLRQEMKGELAAAQALNQQLLTQIDDLEEERLRLLQALRLNAKQMAASNMKNLGLLPDQIVLLNEFVENLKTGKADLRPAPISSYSRQLQEEIQQLRVQLASAEARADASLPGSHSGHSEASHRPQHITTPIGNMDSTSPPLEALQRDLRALLDENRVLRDSVNRLERANNTFSEEGKTKAIHQGSSARRSGGVGAHPDGADDVDGPTARAIVAELRHELQRFAAARQGDQAQNERQPPSSMLHSISNTDIVHAIMAELRDTHSELHEVKQALFQAKEFQQAQLRTPEEEWKLATEGIKRPTSPAAKELQKRSEDLMKLPPEEWAEEISNLNSQLIACLEELASKEDRIRELDEALQQYELKMAAMSDQQTVLYLEHVKEKKRAEEQLRHMADKMRYYEEYRMKADSWDKLEVDNANPAEEDPKALLRKYSVRAAVLEVNECILSRKYNLLAEEAKTERSTRLRIQDEAVEMEKALKLRVKYLESWKLRAETRLERLNSALDISVPRSEYRTVRRELKDLKVKYATVLESEASIRAEWISTRLAPAMIAKLQHSIKALETDLSAARQSQRAAVAADSLKMESSSTSGVHPASVDDLTKDLAKYRGETMRLEVELAGSAKKNQIHEARISELEGALEALQRIKLELEDKAKQQATAVEKSLANARHVLDTFEGGATRERTALMQQRIQELEDQTQQLLTETERIKEVADIALAQSQAFEARKQSQETEIEALKHRLRDIESKRDDDTVIGQLQHTIVTLKLSYQAFVRKHDITRSNLRRQDLRVRTLETQLEEKGIESEKAREELRAQAMTLEKVLRQLSSDDNEPIMQLNLRPMEQLSAKIRELSERLAKQQTIALSLSEESQALKTKIEEKEMETEITKRQLSDLKLLSDGKATSSEYKDLSRRLMELSEENKRAKIEALRVRREVQTSRDQKRSLQEQLQQQEDTIRRLEEELVLSEHNQTQTQAMAKEDLSRIQDLLKGLPIPQARFLLNAAKDPSNSLTKLKESNFRLSRQDKDIAELKKTKFALESQLEEVKQMYVTKAEQLKLYESQLDKAGVKYVKASADSSDPGDLAPASPTRQKVLTYFQEDQEKLQRAAHATMTSLKQLLGEKNRIIEDYKLKLEETRRRSVSDRELDKAEIERLNERIYLENTEAIAKLRTALKKLEQSPDNALAGVQINQNLVQQLEDAHRAIADREDQIKDVEGEVKKALVMKDKAEERAGEALEKIHRLRRELKQAREEASEARQEVENVKQDKRMEKLVATLKAQILAKEKKLSALRETVIKMKEEFVKSEEAHEVQRIKAEKDLRAKDLDRIVELEDTVTGLQKKIDNLENNNKSLREKATSLRAELKTCKEKESAVQKQKEELRNLAERFNKKSSEIADNELRGENNRLRKSLEESLVKESKLKDIVRGLKRKLGIVGEVDSHAESAPPPVSDERLERLEAQVQMLAEKRDAEKPLEAGTDTSHPTVPLLRNQSAAEAVTRRAAGLPTPQGASSEKQQQAFRLWDLDKRQKKRIEVLTARLEERRTELDAANSQIEQLQVSLAALTKEKEILQKRTAEKKLPVTGQFDGLMTLEELRKRVLVLEEEKAALKHEIEVENAREINSLRHEALASEKAVRDMEEHLKEVRRKLREQRRLSSTEDSKTRSDDDIESKEEDSLEREERLRDRVLEAQREVRELDAKVLDRETTMMELRFQNEDKNIQIDRLHRRLKEVEHTAATLKALVRDQEKGSSASSGREKPGTPRATGADKFKREKELEAVVEALKRVIEKLKSENERLKRSSASAAKLMEQAKHLREAQLKLKQLEEEKLVLSSRLESSEDASKKLAVANDTVASLKKQVAKKDSEISKLRQENSLLRDDLDNLKADADSPELLIESNRELQEEVARLKEEARKRGLRARDSSRKPSTEEGDSENEATLVEKRKRIQRLERTIEDLREENAELLSENEKLARELSAFDLEFFEEIEDLKYKYSEALKLNDKLQSDLKRLRSAAG